MQATGYLEITCFGSRDVQFLEFLQTNAVVQCFHVYVTCDLNIAEDLVSEYMGRSEGSIERILNRKFRKIT